MTSLRDNISQAVVDLPLAALRKMIDTVRLLDRLSRQPEYRAQVYPLVPEIARFDPGYASVMMCYDFHLVDGLPRLIEVNTNAGGVLPAFMTQNPSAPVDPGALPAKLRRRLLGTFAEEVSLFSGGARSKPQRIVIVDDKPTEQFLFPEMQAFAELFRSWGVPTEIVEPAALAATMDGVSHEGQPVDLVYNRHCDFYLESEVMAGLRAAYRKGSVCLTPNPHMYGLLADKRRMVLWAKPGNWPGWEIGEREGRLLEQVLPESWLLADGDRQEAWSQRKQLVFKPVDSFGSRGVLLGEKISRKRFDELPGTETLVQERVPPSMTEAPGLEPMKTDLRLYAYRSRVLGVTARLYRGQVTNLRTPGGGFARVRLV